MYNPELTVATAVIIPFIFALAIGIVLYVFNSLAMYTIAKRRGISAPYTAWIPFASTFLMGKIAEQYETAEHGKSKPYRKILLGLEIPSVSFFIVFYIYLIIQAVSIGINALSYYPSEEYIISTFASMLVIFFLLAIIWLGIAIAYAVFYYIALYKIYRSLSPNTSTMFLILSIFFSVITPFVLFAQRNKDDGFIELNNRYRADQYSQQHHQQQTYSNAYQPPYNNAGQYQQPTQNINQQYGQQSYSAPQYQPPTYTSYDHYNNNNGDKNN